MTPIGVQTSVPLLAGLMLMSLQPSGLTAQDPARRAYEILEANCFQCHGRFIRGELDLRTQQSLVRGSKSGRVVVPHDPEQSLLYKLVTHQQEPAMPYEKPKLADVDLEALRQWIIAGGSLATVPEANAGAEIPEPVPERVITEEERQSWVFQPPVRHTVPLIAEPGWEQNPVDAFLAAAMEKRGLKPSPMADRRTTIRRLYIDVTGLPPTPEEVEEFLADDTPDAWEQLVDRVLASPHYGERWARHWLDLARYADTGGFEFDTDRPGMWRYRDYVVNSFNADKPYDDFIREQLAGDEYRPDSDEAMIATGFLRLGPDLPGPDQLDDIVSTTSLAIMGMTIGCARCHDHKFDPILQRDYDLMAAVFSLAQKVEHPLVPEGEVAAHRAETRRLDGLIRPRQREKRDLEEPHREKIVAAEVALLPRYMRIAWNTPEEERTEGQRLNVIQIERALQISDLRAKITEADIVAMMSAAQKQRHTALKAQIRNLERQKPEKYPAALAMSESRLRGRGRRGRRGPREAAAPPGVLTVAAPANYSFPGTPDGAESSQRRLMFAEWLVSPGNPLTARVMVNRIWQHHFGEGIVRTPSNFGKMGLPPTHPELLDWLATEFVARGWSIKEMHRLMLRSRAYRMSSDDIASNMTIDSQNHMFWRMPRQRVEAEIVRDLILAAAGTLDPEMGGPNIFPYIDPDLFEKSSKRDWPGLPDDDPSTWRRSLYVYSKRSIRYPMFESFDQPNLINSVDRRNRSTVAPQALILMNNAFVLFHAGEFARRLEREAGVDVQAQVQRGFLVALSRLPDGAELQMSVDYVQREGLAGFCHILFNLNEFLYSQ